MSDLGPVTCEEFDARADELALEQVVEPGRARLLAHAGACGRCHALLVGLSEVTDRLLLAAPQAEPLPGFEARALARLGAPPADRRRPARPWRWPALAAAAAATVLIAGVAVAAQRDRPSDAATIVARGTATPIGSVRLVGEPSPHVLVAIGAPRPDPGTRHCELRRADGTWVRVGSWEAADMSGGVWAVGVDRSLLDATGMRIVTDAGTVLASATWR